MSTDVQHLPTPSSLSVSGQSLWIFGYGSLTWKPGMHYTSKEIGFIRGFKRRFWQGSVTHRGTANYPGRVATMVADENSLLWGVAYEITGLDSIRKTLKDLNERESILGGYITYYLPFHERSSSLPAFNVLIYAATSANPLFLGEASMEAMARQISETGGSAGINADYVTKLADFTRDNIPEDTDEHMFELDRRIREIHRSSIVSLKRSSLSEPIEDISIVLPTTEIFVNS